MEGRVVDSKGRPLQGATVTAGAEIDNVHHVHTTESRRDGAFTVSGFPPTVRLFAWAETDGLASQSYGPIALPQSNDMLEIILHTESIVRGTVVDERGNPLEGMRIVPQFVSADILREVEVTSDAHGRFELSGMFPGSSSLLVCRDDINIINLGQIPYITLSAGEVIDGVTLVCEIADQSITGIVVNSRGAPVAGAHVESPMTGYERVRTDNHGHFDLPGLSTAIYRIQASKRGYVTTEIQDIASGTSDVRIVLPDAIRVEGVVIDAATKQPITNYELKYCWSPKLMLLDQNYESMSSDNGSFALDVEQDGLVRVAARAPGYLLGYTDLQLDAGTSLVQDVTVLMHPSSSIQVAVHNQHGEPLAGVLIQSGAGQKSDADSWGAGRTDANGRFSIAPTAIAHDVLTFIHPDLPMTRVPLEPRHYEGEQLDVVLQEGTELDFTVYLNGRPFPNASISFQNINETLATDQNGNANTKTIPSGVYDVMVSFNFNEADGNTYWMTYLDVIEVVPGARSDVFIDAAGGTASISGAITGVMAQTMIQLEIDTVDGARKYYRLYDGSVPPSYVFHDLPPGIGTLRFSYTLPDGQRNSTTLDITIADGESVELDLSPNLVASTH